MKILERLASGRGLLPRLHHFQYVILCADGAEGSEEMSFVVVYVGGSRRK